MLRFAYIQDNFRNDIHIVVYIWIVFLYRVQLTIWHISYIGVWIEFC